MHNLACLLILICLVFFGLFALRMCPGFLIFALFFDYVFAYCFVQLNKPQMDSKPSTPSVSSQNTIPPMNPADLQAALLRQGAIICTYQNQVEALQAENLQLQQMSQAQAAPPPCSRCHFKVASESLRMAFPDKFDGSVTAVEALYDSETSSSPTSLKSTQQIPPGVFFYLF